MRVLKFGGTSVATAEAIGRVVAIVADQCTRDVPAVVVSALGGVTNGLLGAADAAAGRASWEAQFEALRDRHLATVDELGVGDLALESVRTLCGELHELLRGVYLLREVSPRARDGIASYGERLSSQIVAAALARAGTPAGAVDARRLIVTDDTFGGAAVDLETSYANLRQMLGPDGTWDQGVPVITGFLGATTEGQTTTLGRGGSDYTAALVGAALGAPTVEIWTDVDGVLSADPRVVEDAFPQEEMSYAELMEMSHFGAKVVHPPSIHPARAAGIPLWIRNTFRPEVPGTLVQATAARSKAPIRGISSIREVALLNLEGDGMVGVPGIAERLFGALARRQVSVILISQSSSEHSICFAVAPADAEAARRAVDGEFELERRAGLVDPLVVEMDHSVLAAVGEEMAHRPGIAGKLFGVLGRHGVNVRAIAQGSSELNVSFVVESKDESAAVRAIHGAFFHPRRRVLDIALAGVGTVGGALLRQLADNAARLARDEDVVLRVVALASSRRMLLDENGIDLEGLGPETVRALLDEAQELDPGTLLGALRKRSGARRVFVDVTASDVDALPSTVAWYAPLLSAGVAVVAANKKPFSDTQQRFDALCAAARDGVDGRQVPLRYETTAGAGLPVVSTLQGLVITGDTVRRMDAVLSGTLNAVLDRLSVDVPFSAAVRSAYDDGLTEPHPYDDLSGLDVQRKLLILARTAGHRVEPWEVTVEPLLGDDWAGLYLDTFWAKLPEVDADFETRRAEAEQRGERLRYVASVVVENAAQASMRVGLAAVGPDHPAYGLTGPDNLVAFTTDRYPVPLVVRGAGAGPDVTAAGVFADILACL